MRTTRSIAAAFSVAAVALSALAVVERASATGAATPGAHVFGVSAIEIKGGTTTDKLTPPSVSPTELSKGYGYKAPGEADKNSPQRWEVSSYLFSPDFLVVRQGDQVSLRVFVVNGDEHETHVTDPDGKLVVPHAVWNRGRAYTASFVAEKAGLYELGCTTHAPSMYTKVLALPRRHHRPPGRLGLRGAPSGGPVPDRGAEGGAEEVETTLVRIMDEAAR